MDLLEAIESVATLFALIAGGIWAYVKLRKRREHAPRIEFSVDIDFVGIHGGHWMVELVALVENKGLVRHEIRDFSFDLRTLNEADPLIKGGDKINGQVQIPHLVNRGSWLPSDWNYTFVEPGLETRYSHVAAIPQSASFALLHGRFGYGGSGDYHTADRLVSVPLPGIEHEQHNSRL